MPRPKSRAVAHKTYFKGLSGMKSIGLWLILCVCVSQQNGSLLLVEKLLFSLHNILKEEYENPSVLQSCECLYHTITLDAEIMQLVICWGLFVGVRLFIFKRRNRNRGACPG